ncbi:MAG: AAA family ATPase [Thermoflexaceae bacterium]|nr:AAA family ATPase [Thermoflexaceae bacterium]
MASLREALEAGARGEGRVVLLAGEPGIGKSRLLQELAREAQRLRWQALAGRAYDTEGMPPYLPFVEVLRAACDRASEAALAALAAGAPELLPLLPEARTGALDLPASRTLPPAAERFRLFEAVATFLSELARGSESSGLLVVLDDLQWADRTSILLLRHLANRLAGAPMLVAGSYRTSALTPGTALHDTVADMRREHLCEVIQVPPLNESETGSLVAAMTGAPASIAFVRSLHHDTAGNPFFVEEVVRHQIERGTDLSVAPGGAVGTIPESVRQVLGQRLSRLQEATVRALEAGAVLGDTFAMDALMATSGLERAALIGAVEEAERAGMVHPEDEGYAFDHALVRRTVYDGLSVPRRQDLHMTAAEALEALASARTGINPAEIAHHWRACAHHGRATEHFLRAGDAAIMLAAWEEGAKYWEAAANCMTQSGEQPVRRARLLEGIGDLGFLSSLEVHTCVQYYEQASALYESAGDMVGSARARARAGRSLAYPTSGFDFAAAVEYLRAAEKILGDGPDNVELGEIYTALGHAESHALQGSFDEMLKSISRLHGIADSLDNGFLRIGAKSLEGHYLALQGYLARGLELEQLACDEAAAQKGLVVNQWPERWHEYLLGYSSAHDAATSGDTGSYQLSRLLMANYTANCCGLQSLELLDPRAARTKHERIKDAQGQFLSTFYAYDLFLAGELAALKEMLQRTPGSLHEFGRFNPGTEPGLLAMLLLHWYEGELNESMAQFAQRRQHWREAGSNSVLVFANTWVARLARGIGDAALARSVAEESLAVAVRSGALKFEFQACAELALLDAEAGEAAGAERRLRRIREILAAGEDWRGLAGRAALAEAAQAASQGQLAVAATHFEHALRVFRELSLPWDEAEAYEVWARLGRRSHRGRARRAFVMEKLECARAVYQRIGAGGPWFERLDALARELCGDGAGAPAAALPDGLTPREAEILGLLALGRSSKEIGEQLVLSVRTVERHIANIYLKTGCHGRAQAASYALVHHIGAPGA